VRVQKTQGGPLRPAALLGLAGRLDAAEPDAQLPREIHRAPGAELRGLDPARGERSGDADGPVLVVEVRPLEGQRLAETKSGTGEEEEAGRQARGHAIRRLEEACQLGAGHRLDGVLAGGDGSPEPERAAEPVSGVRGDEPVVDGSSSPGIARRRARRRSWRGRYGLGAGRSTPSWLASQVRSVAGWIRTYFPAGRPEAAPGAPPEPAARADGGAGAVRLSAAPRVAPPRGLAGEP
jgi:hypothetical protein